MKIVIDTNILISGADDENSVAWRIVKEVMDGSIQAFATHQTMSENRQMLRKLVKDREYKNRLEDFFRALEIVKPYKKLDVVSDPEDNKLFESAAASGSEYLITRDREVLDVEEYNGTKVLTPEEFWALYEGQNKSENSDWNDWTKMLMGE